MGRIFPMKKFCYFLFAAAFCASVHAASGPIRVLYAGKSGTPAAKHCATLMRELGRDAIWFDFAADGASVTPEWIAKFDAVLVDPPQQSIPGVDAKRVVTAEFPSDEPNAEFIAALREKLLTAAGDARRKELQAFSTQRETEKREPNPNVANYEKRKEPITFQHPMSVKGSMERTQVAPDLRLELFASEPQIAKPIAMAWDERGRLWIAETRDYPHGVTPSGEGHDDIKICEDTNGDGRADKFTIFADRLNLPTSLVFAKGGVIVAQSPRFIFFKDTNGDDKADVRQVIMESWGVQDTHAQASNLHYGYDNWIHGCVGYSGFRGTVGGREHNFSMGTYRFRADGSAIEFLHQFTNNAWAHSQNAAGDDFGGTANGAPIFFGGIPATIAPGGMRVMTAKKINIEDKAHAITTNFRQVDVFGGYTAAAGTAFIHSANLPPRLQGKAMVCEPTMKLLSLMDVQPDGAGYVAKDGFNLLASSDEWMSPVFAEVGPDGAVWVADWQNFIIQHNPTPSEQHGGYNARTGPGGAHENPLRDHDRGRIYRVVWEKAGAARIKSLSGAADDALVAALGSDNQFWRLTAQRLIVDGKKTSAVAALKKVVAANDGNVGAIHALWSLHGLGALDEAAHQGALHAKDAALRRNAVRALGDDAKAQALFFGSSVVTDADPATRLAAFVKLAAFNTTPEIQTLVKKVAVDPVVAKDEWLSEAARVLTRKHKAEAFREGPNLLPNPGFETVGADGLPEGWKRRDYGRPPGNANAEWKVVPDARGGSRAVRCTTRADGDTSFYADVPLKPNTLYKLSGWVKAHAFRGKLSLNDHIGRAETEKLSRDGDWTLVETAFRNDQRPTASINILHVGKGDGYWDDVKLCELLPEEAPSEKALAGDPKRGEEIFWKHPVAACMNCHMLGGKGSTVGPALDGIATRGTPAYIAESLIEPNKVLAKGFEQLGVSPMPPLGLILKAQEIEDIKAFLGTLK
jgi:putative membrane-bound dehydrogenase-like protein